MNKSETNASAVNDVLQSDHHVQMSEEEIAKARRTMTRAMATNPQKEAGKSGAREKDSGKTEVSKGRAGS